MAVAPTSRATLTTRVATDTMRTSGRWARDSSSISSRSARSNRGSAFWGLRRAATTTSSKSRPARSTTSRWPLWNGSNEPGKRATFTRCLGCGESAAAPVGPPSEGSADHGHERTAVAACPDDLPARRAPRPGPTTRGPPPSASEPAEQVAPVVEGVGGVAEGQVEPVGPTSQPEERRPAPPWRRGRLEPRGRSGWPARPAGPRVVVDEDGRGRRRATAPRCPWPRSRRTGRPPPARPRRPSTPRMSKIDSRTRSEVGRTPAGRRAGRRRPRLDPPITRTVPP